MDIKIEQSSLDNLVKKLENDNLNIYNIIKDMHIAFKTLDNSKWTSIEKQKLDSTLNPMIQSIDNNLLLYLNNCTDTLKLATNSYEKSDLNLKSNIE